MKKIISVCVLVLVLMLAQVTHADAKKYKNNLKPTKSNIEWLARTIYAENGGSRNNKTIVLTGIVVCQRVRSSDFPNTIKKVISQKGQYSTWSDGKIKNCKPSKKCYKIAKKILKKKLYLKYPKKLVFQSQFRQGTKTYKYITEDNEYFCLR